MRLSHLATVRPPQSLEDQVAADRQAIGGQRGAGGIDNFGILKVKLPADVSAEQADSPALTDSGRPQPFEMQIALDL